MLCAGVCVEEESCVCVRGRRRCYSWISGCFWRLCGYLHGAASWAAGKRGLEEHWRVEVELKNCISSHSSSSSLTQVATTTQEIHLLRSYFCCRRPTHTSPSPYIRTHNTSCSVSSPRCLRQMVFLQQGSVYRRLPSSRFILVSMSMAFSAQPGVAIALPARLHLPTHARTTRAAP